MTPILAAFLGFLFGCGCCAVLYGIGYRRRVDAMDSQTKRSESLTRSIVACLPGQVRARAELVARGRVGGGL